MAPTWQSDCGRIQLYIGDCRDILPSIQCDAFVTDPPYGVNFSGKVTKHSRGESGYISGDSEIGPVVIDAALSVCSRGIVFPGTRLMWRYQSPADVGFVWCPSGAGIGRWGFTCAHPILYYGKCPQRGATPSCFESFAVSEKNGHPCPKPIEWMRWAVLKCTLEEETICDPFMGSGTTGVACVQLNRRFIGIEKEPKYFEIAKRRIMEAMGKEVSVNGFKQRRMFT